MLKGRENDEIVHLDAAVACKRGILLFAIWRLPEWSNSYFSDDEVVLADLQRRILPLIGPLFLANIGQRPDAFVAMVGTMHRLWTGKSSRAHKLDRTWIVPLGSVMALAIENAEAPPPEGSTAVNVCMTLRRWSRSCQTSRSGGLCSNAVMSSSRRSFSLPSALMPNVSRSSMAGSSESSVRTISTFFEEIHLGISDICPTHRSRIVCRKVIETLNVW